MAKRWQFQTSIECVLLKAGNVDIYLLETVSGRKSCTVVGWDSAELGWDEQEVGTQNGLRNPVRPRRKPQHILERMVHTNVSPSYKQDVLQEARKTCVITDIPASIADFQP